MEPSPLALEVLSARPYAYLDDAPLEERRTQAVMSRRWLAPEEAADIGRLDPEAVSRVRSEVTPDPRNPVELHDTLVWFGCVTEDEIRANEQWSEWCNVLARDKRATRISGPASSLWIAAERLPQFRALWPDARFKPSIVSPAGVTANWTSDTALIEILRGRLEGQGPVTETALAAALGLDNAVVNAALLALQSEGFALCGHYSPDLAETEWCDRRLVARMHRYTIKRLRAEIEPVAPRDFIRFLLSWQRVEAGTHMEGRDAVGTIIEQLEGYEIPAGAWETEILPARLSRYNSIWLDHHGAAGRVIWTRSARRGAGPRPGPMRSTAIALVPRLHARHWPASVPGVEQAPKTARAQKLLTFLQGSGASFFDQMHESVGGLRCEVEDALAELAGLGLVTSDGFNGLRALIGEHKDTRLIGRNVGKGFDETGRWSLVPQWPEVSSATPESTEHIARVLLRRYGVVFWTVLEREMTWLPPWRELLAVYRCLEARGEIRGGRFVAGFSGEQFALPEAIGLLRETRRNPTAGTLTAVSGADPLNLMGILTPGVKLPARGKNRLLYRDGSPIAWMAGGEVKFSGEIAPADQWQLRKLLVRGPVPKRSELGHRFQTAAE